MTRIIDCHCHIYPEKIALKAVDSVAGFYDGLLPRPWNGTIAELVQTGNRAGITHFIVFSVATNPHQVSRINAFIARSVQESGGCMTGLGAMHPDSEDLARDIDEIQALGLKGIKLHPDIQRFDVDHPRAMEMYQLCEERGLIVCLHAGDNRYDYSSPDRIARIAAAFPRLRIIAAHFGGYQVWEEASKKLSPYPNIIVDTSSSLHWLSPDTARTILRRYGAERVLFGTDYPLWPQQDEIDQLNALGLEPEEYERIWWRNAADLYGLHFDGEEN